MTITINNGKGRGRGDLSPYCNRFPSRSDTCYISQFTQGQNSAASPCARKRRIKNIVEEHICLSLMLCKEMKLEIRWVQQLIKST